MMLQWSVKVYRMRKRDGREYPYIYLPAEFRPYIGKRFTLTFKDGKIILEEEKQSEQTVQDTNNKDK